MTNEEIERINKEYKEYCKKEKHPLPFIIWLKHKKIEPSDYYMGE